jgi:hypothetical protein
MMNQELDKNNYTLSFDDLKVKASLLLKMIRKNLLKIFIVGVIGSFLGILGSFLIPIKYIARISFVVEEGKSSVGGIAALAGQFGFDIGGGGGAGLFSGDNIILFLKSESLCRETLLTPLDEKSKQTLADRYAESQGWKKKWLNKKEIGPVLFWEYMDKQLPRKEDSLLQVITQNILKKDLFVVRPDKKSSFVEVRFISRDEILSNYFAQKLIEIATERYVNAKVKVKAKNVEILQRRADSLSRILNSRTFSAAYSQQNLVDMNPALKGVPIDAEISTREKTIAAALFSEVVKNLEISKTILSQETPAIEIVDYGNFPLPKQKPKKLLNGILCGFLFVFLYFLWLLRKGIRI